MTVKTENPGAASESGTTTAPSRRPAPPAALHALALAAFAIGTTEFVVVGLLPRLSAAFGVSSPTAGLLVTGYAAGVALGGPLLAPAVRRLPLRRALGRRRRAGGARAAAVVSGVSRRTPNTGPAALPLRGRAAP